jgi:flagellar basal-body rod protein FlgG
MQEILNITLHSLQNDMRRLEIINMNLANTQTIGYQREIALTSPFSDLLQTESTTTSVRDTHSGALKASGQSLDVALMGAGYFEVATAHGLAYTRDGNFHLDAHGRLVSAAGDAVMGIEGEIVLDSERVNINAAGQIRAVDNPSGPPLARLKIVDFETPSRLQSLGGGLLSAGSSSAAAISASPNLQQGSLENANVNSMQEMLQLMHTMRHAEAMQKLAQGYDDMLGNAIRQLAKE